MIDYFNNFKAESELDFHKYNKIYPFEVERISNQYIEDNFYAGKRKIRIITGKGEIVRPAVLKVLKKSKYIYNYNVAGYFSGQNGAFEVILKNEIYNKKNIY